MSKKRWMGLAGVTLVAFVVAIFVIANSGGSGESTASAGDQFAKFQGCLSDQGVDMPTAGDGGTPGGAPPARAPQLDAKTQAAMRACSRYAPSGGPGVTAPTGKPPSGTPPTGTPPTGTPSIDVTGSDS